MDTNKLYFKYVGAGAGISGVEPRDLTPDDFDVKGNVKGTDIYWERLIGPYQQMEAPAKPSTPTKTKGQD